MKTTRLQFQAPWSMRCSAQRLIIITLLALLWYCCNLCTQQLVEAQDILASGKYYASGLNTAGPNKLDPRIRKDLDYNDPTIYFKEDSVSSFFNGRFTYDDYLVYAMRSNSLVAGIDSDVHRYDHQQDLLNSIVRSSSKRAKSSPTASANNETIESADQVGLSIEDEDELQQAKCGQHLDAVLKESQQLFVSQEAYSTSRQLNFIEYLDSFGWPKSQVMQGNHFFLGSHEQCSRANLAKALENRNGANNNSERLGTRYCVANYRSPNWPVVGPNEKIERIGAQASFKLGICLPDSCNTVSVTNHLSRIDSLIKLVRLNQVPYSGYQITNLFCLPDERSPLRQFSLSAKIFILLLTSWLTTVVYFSLKYEYQRMKWIQSHGNSDEFLTIDTSNSMKIFAFRLSWSKLFEIKAPKPVSAMSTAMTTAKGNQHYHHHLHSPNTRRRSNLIDAMINPRIGDTGEKLRQRMVPDLVDGSAESHVSSCRDCCPLSELSSSTTQTQQASTRDPVSRSSSTNSTSAKHSQNPVREVDLSIIDGLKVVSMIWLVCAHTLLIYIRTIANGREFWSILKDSRYLTVMAGIFTVDTFFTATGVLTAFLKFNKNDGVAMGKANYWLEVFTHRYFRFMPMYFLAFWYARDVAEYTGVGPMWDYGTADTSLRSICKQESVTVPLLFRANFRSIDETCVRPAWYLANDYQFQLITPIFLALILRSKSIGYSVLIGGTILSLILQFLTIFYAGEWNDFQVLINFKPMFAAYVLKNFWQLYVLPYNRIPPYLIGLLTGHLIYSLSKSYTAQRHLRQHQHQDQEQDFVHHNGSSSKIGIIHSQESLVSSPNSPHRESTSDIITRHSNRSYSSSSSSTNFIASLESYLCLRVWIPAMILISLIYLPMMASRTEMNLEGLTAKIGTSALIALMRFIWSLAIARLIYISSTRFLDINNLNKPSGKDSFVIRFLSSTIWQPWAKMGLTALLVQWEVIGYLYQTQTGLPIMTMDLLLSNAALSIVFTYILSLLLYLTVEYPLSQVEKLYIHPMIFPKS